MFTNRPAKNGHTINQNDYDVLAEAKAVGAGDQVSADAYMIRDRVQRRLLAEADGEVDLSHIPQMHQMIEALFNRILTEENLLYTRAVRSRLLDWVIADILGFGPI
jgi:hypothetical protein